MKKKTKVRQPRNWNAVAAHFRNSSGAMKEKPQATNERDWDNINWQEDQDYGHVNCDYCNQRDIFEELMEGVEEMKKVREDK